MSRLHPNRFVHFGVTLTTGSLRSSNHDIATYEPINRVNEVGKTTTHGDVDTANDNITRESNGQVFFDTFSTNGDRLDQDSNDLSEESDKPESDTAEGKESTSKHDNKHNEGQSNPKVRSCTDREPAVVSNEADATKILHPSCTLSIEEILAEMMIMMESDNDGVLSARYCILTKILDDL